MLGNARILPNTNPEKDAREQHTQYQDIAETGTRESEMNRDESILGW
jgi:hypothetical protein